MLQSKIIVQRLDLREIFVIQSGAAPLSRITLAHFCDSTRIQCVNSSGEFATTSKPCFPRVSRVSDVLIARMDSALSRPTIPGGVPAGPRKPIQARDSSCG